MENFKQKFYDITVLIQQEFDRNLGLYGDKIQCKRGCSKCCSQIFRITALDGWIIGEHIRALPASEHEALKDKAGEYIENSQLDHPGSSSHPSLKKEGSNSIPCPALGSEGECTIYNARPVICRRFGMPIYDYKNPKKLHACELNFSDGDEITDNMLVPTQTYIGKKWDELKAEFGEGSTTIAEAIFNA